jgi:hypothetical protein
MSAYRRDDTAAARQDGRRCGLHGRRPPFHYSTGHAPRSFDGTAQTVGSSGVVGWTWHMLSSGTGGTATVMCSLGGQTRSAHASFAIA